LAISPIGYLSLNNPPTVWFEDTKWGSNKQGVLNCRAAPAWAPAAAAAAPAAPAAWSTPHFISFEGEPLRHGAEP
jgi:hypothetical protein